MNCIVAFLCGFLLMTFVLNLIWFVFGGLFGAILWTFVGIVFMLSIAGLPWALASFRIAGFVLWPFGKEIVRRDSFTGKKDLGTGCLGTGLNVIWFLVAGWWLALFHLTCAFLEAITIIGIPFAKKDLEIAYLTLAPLGMTILPKP